MTLLRLIDALGDAHPLLLDIFSGDVILSVLTSQVIINLLLSLGPFIIEPSPVLFLLPLIGNILGVGENGSPTPYFTTRHVSGPITR